MSRVSSLPISSLAGFDASAIRSGTAARQGDSRAAYGAHREAIPMNRVRADAGVIAVSAAHSAPAGIATGSPCPRHAPALLAQCNAAARAFRSRSSGLVADHRAIIQRQTVDAASMSTTTFCQRPDGRGNCELKTHSASEDCQLISI